MSDSTIPRLREALTYARECLTKNAANEGDVAAELIEAYWKGVVSGLKQAVLIAEDNS